MTPNLALSQHFATRDMILNSPCNQLSHSIRTPHPIEPAPLRIDQGTAKWWRSTEIHISSHVTALLDKFGSEPSLFLEDMAACLNDEFDTDATRLSVGRALKAAGWSRKSTQNVAKERNARLRDEYMHEISCMRSDQLVFIDDTGSDRSIGTRNKGCAPRGSAPS
ncbi:hypothetical protein PCL_07471 [Purpureocillium lilacinum]|uniref:Transposase n=1 Tax=Purpureocillium lilacinum TaxID=33203 RepID=A0A2U3DS36_PURLI|nr:hypothetical protein PCL_07471 [Purpureocillium lilacinum]